MYLYRARVERVIDGDTFEATLDLGFGIFSTQIFRVSNLDTPEIYKPRNEAEKEHGLQAMKKAIELLKFPDKDFHLLIKSEKRPKIYGRYSAIIRLTDNRDYAEEMHRLGFNKKDHY